MTSLAVLVLLASLAVIRWLGRTRLVGALATAGFVLGTVATVALLLLVGLHP